jgi:hypothetical protein
MRVLEAVKRRKEEGNEREPEPALSFTRAHTAYETY